MGIQPPPPNGIAAWPWQNNRATPRKQRPGQQDRRADFARERCVGLCLANIGGLERPGMIANGLYLHAKLLEQGDFIGNIADLGDIAQNNRVCGQQGCCNQGQRSIFIPGWHNTTG
jgi:hypothetical protein